MKKVTIILRNGVEIEKEFEEFRVSYSNGIPSKFSYKMDGHFYLNPLAVDCIHVEEV